MPTLYEIGAEIRDLQVLLDDLEGDITSREEEIDAWLNQVDLARDQKIDAYAGLIQELVSRRETREKEAMRLQHRANMDGEKAEFLKRRLKTFFQITDLKTVETPRFRVTLAGHGGKLPVVLLASAEMLPMEFQRVKTELKPDLEAIRDHLAAHGPLTAPSGELLAHFGERGESIRVR